MKFKKRYIIVPLVVILIIIFSIAILIKIDRDYKRKVIEQDEAQYGNDYRKLQGSLSYYTQSPDRIIYKPKMKDYFYVIDKNDENYAHLLEVAEDRMSYSLAELGDAFQVDSMDRIMSSGKNYIILDYDKEKYGNIGVDDGTMPRPVVYKLLDNNRCARLFKYVTQFMKRYTMEELEEMLGKTGFSINDAVLEDAKVQEDINDGYTRIYSIDDFRRIANNPSGKYKLVNDLDFKGASIRLNSITFSGEIDGDGHTIKNVSGNDPAESRRIAMFYTNEGTIKNLNIENINVNIVADEDVYYQEGILAQINQGTIENCTTSGNINIQSVESINFIGGIVGNLYGGTIRNCVNKVNITCPSGTVGGITAYRAGGVIENCINEGNLTGSNVNGICMEYAGTLSNCVNKGKIVAESFASGLVTYNFSNMINCKNYGDITSNNNMAAGIAIYNYASIENCINQGNLSGSNIVASIAGTNGDPNGAEGIIKNCTSSGIITINTAKQYEQDILYIGGIVGNHILGRIEGSTFDGSLIVNTNKTTYKGTLAGAKSTKATIDVNQSYGYQYDFQTYYEEHWMETLRD